MTVLPVRSTTVAPSGIVDVGGQPGGGDAPLVHDQHSAPDGRTAVSGNQGRPLVGHHRAGRGFGSVAAATGGDAR